VASNLNHLFKIEGLLKVHCNYGNIWEMVPDRVVSVICGPSNRGSSDDLESLSRSFPL